MSIIKAFYAIYLTKKDGDVAIFSPFDTKEEAEQRKIELIKRLTTNTNVFGFTGEGYVLQLGGY